MSKTLKHWCYCRCLAPARLAEQTSRTKKINGCREHPRSCVLIVVVCVDICSGNTPCVPLGLNKSQSELHAKVTGRCRGEDWNYFCYVHRLKSSPIDAEPAGVYNYCVTHLLFCCYSAAAPGDIRLRCHLTDLKSWCCTCPRPTRDTPVVLGVAHASRATRDTPVVLGVAHVPGRCVTHHLPVQRPGQHRVEPERPRNSLHTKRP